MTVEVLATIDEDDKVEGTSVSRSSRNRLVDRAAMAAVEHWRYHCQGTPGTVLLTVRIPAPRCKLDSDSWREHRPIYPERLTRERVKGSVELSLRPGADGRTEVSLKTGSGHADADNAVLDAARKWRFSCDSSSAPTQTALTTEQFNFSGSSIPEKQKVKAPSYSDELRTTVRDTLPMEYAHAGQFLNDLPNRNDVELNKELVAPGLKVYTTSLKKVMEQILSSDQLEQPDVTTWTIFMPPHPWAPSVIRTRSETVTDEPSGQRRPITRINYLCESITTNCAQVENRVSEMVKPVSATQ
ncbi:TonB family protein [Xanthomonas phaseoli]|nr:TonB family protein [Xanthomonas phaseoli]